MSSKMFQSRQMWTKKVLSLQLPFISICCVFCDHKKIISFLFLLRVIYCHVDTWKAPWRIAVGKINQANKVIGWNLVWTFFKQNFWSITDGRESLFLLFWRRIQYCRCGVLGLSRKSNILKWNILKAYFGETW